MLFLSLSWFGPVGCGLQYFVMFMTQMLAFLAWHGLGSSHCDIGQQVPKRSGLIIFKQYIVVTTECKKQI